MTCLVFPFAVLSSLLFTRHYSARCFLHILCGNPKFFSAKSVYKSGWYLESLLTCKVPGRPDRKRVLSIRLSTSGGSCLNVVAHCSSLMTKNRAYKVQFLYALTPLLYLILIDTSDYANCITSASSSFNSSRDNDGT